MSFGDPNNPYGPPPPQPPSAAPQYGYPQQSPAAAPNYGYPQQQGYGYPQQPAYPGYPGGNQLPQTMPGLMMTARVLLFIVAAAQVLIGIGMLIFAATVNDAANASDSTVSDSEIADFGHASAAVLLVVALVFLGFTALSITLGVKFSRGGQGIRITTMVYGILGALLGVLGLISAASQGSTATLVGALLWVGFGGTMAAAMIAPSGAAWFNRPRY